MDHSRLAIALLQRSHDLYSCASKPPPRIILHIGGLLAQEHLELGDAETAQRLLEVVVGEHHNSLAQLYSFGLKSLVSAGVPQDRV